MPYRGKNQITGQLHLQKCRVEGGGGRSWKDQVKLRFEEMYVRLTGHLIFINVLVFTAPTREKECNVLLVM